MLIFEKCNISILLIYFGAIFIITTLYFIIFVSIFNSPLDNIINRSNTLKNIRKDTYKSYKKILLFGLCISIFLMYYFKPFKGISIQENINNPSEIIY